MVSLRQAQVDNSSEPINEFTERINIQAVFEYFKKPFESQFIEQNQRDHFGGAVKPSRLKILKQSKHSLSVLTLSQASTGEFRDCQKAFIDKLKSLLRSFEGTFDRVISVKKDAPFYSSIHKGFTIVEAYKLTEGLQSILQMPSENYIELANPHKYYWNEFNLFHLNLRANSLVCHLLQNINLNDVQNSSLPWMKTRNLTSVYLNRKKNFFPALVTWNHPKITTSTVSRRNGCLAIDMLLVKSSGDFYRLNSHVKSLETVLNQHLGYINNELLETDREL